MALPEVPDLQAEADLIDSGHVDLAALKRSSMRGMAINFGSQLIKFVLQLLYQIAVMRLLQPGDFGLIAMAAPIFVFVQMFADCGLTQAVIQKRYITRQQVSFLFWFSAVVSGAFSLLTIALAPLAGWFYGEPRVVPIVMALGGLLFLSGLQSQPLALLNRRMDFSKIAVITLGSLTIGMGTSIASAFAGAGYWALVYYQAATTVSSLLLAWFLARWLPDRPACVGNVRSLIHFGGNLTGFNLANFFARNLDNVLIGRVWGDAALGLYDRAYKLLLLPLTQIVDPVASVALPMLARTLHDPAVYRRAFLRLLETIILLTWPGVLFAIGTSHDLIVTVLGERWEGIAPIFAILSIGGLLAPIGHASGWLFISQDRAREMRNWGIFSSAFFALSFVIGLPFGPLGVAVSYTGFVLVLGPVLWWLATRQGPISLHDLLLALYPLGLGGIASFAAVWLLRMALVMSPLSLAMLFLASYAAFIGALACLPRGRALLTDLWKYTSHLTWKKAET